jgi:hypothetical protein
MAGMWMGPALFVATSIVLWKYAGAVFMPLLMARSLFGLMPLLADMETVILINMALIYFAAYFLVAIFWHRLKPYLKNPFLLAFELWLINIVVVFPILGRGILGYQLPQGWMSASLPLLVSHWMFARGVQFQQRR